MVVLCITASGHVVADGASNARVGAELRRIREAAGLSGSAVARELGWSQSKVSRVETGRFGASIGEVSELLDFYGVAQEVRAELLSAVARVEGLEGSWVVRAGGSPRRQVEVQTVESRVRRIRQYQALWVPGLLQSPEYAAAVARAGNFGAVDTFVSTRLQRQVALTNGRGVRYDLVVEQDALIRAPGRERDVVPAQLDHLMAAVDGGRIDLRIRPTLDAKEFCTASFVLYDFREGPPVVLYEAHAADLYLSAAADVTAHERLFRNLQREALDRDASRTLIESMRRERASQPT
jgi:transcriptional regulator with XRE-family HTH domain